jgi:O-antigen/teichoic acid export membrane protein
MAIGLFTTRIVLDTLGETNYGIYTLVAGVVGMLAIFKSAMTTTSMRYMAHNLGSGDADLISRTFNTTLFLHMIIGIAIMAFIEAGGFLMFKYFLDIPTEKVFEAKVVFHLMVLTTFVAIIAVPYDAVINSHENLLFLSIADIIGAILKLSVAIYLTFTDYNLLITYGIGLFIVQFIVRIIKQQYSVRRYTECSIDFKNARDKKLSKQILSFTGWSLFGSIAAISVTQIRTVLLNVFFGVNVNASEGIAKTASGHVNTVSISITRAINPQLMKSEGSGDREKMLRITSMSTKFSLFLFSLLAIPIIIEMPYLFKLWLKEIPEFAVIFARLTLIGLLISKASFEITAALRAVGKIKKFTISESVIIVLNVPLTYMLFRAGYPPATVYIVAILISIIVFFERLYFGRKIAGLNIRDFFRTALLPIVLPISIATLVSLVFHLILITGVIRFCLVFIVFILCFSLIFRFFGLTQYEYNKIKVLIQKWFLKKNRSK